MDPSSEVISQFGLGPGPAIAAVIAHSADWLPGLPLNLHVAMIPP